MFQVITGGQGTEFLQFMIVGSALWNVVFGVMAGLVQSILEDRERYRMIKYVVVTPPSLFPFLLGRSLAASSSRWSAVALTLVVGIVFLGVELGPNLLYLVPASVLGVLSVVALGIFMAGWCLQLRQEAWSLSGGDRRRALPHLGRDLPDRRPADLPPADRLRDADDLVARGVAARPARPRLAGRRSASCPDGLVMLFLFVTTAIALPLGARRLRLVHAPRPPGGAARHGDRQPSSAALTGSARRSRSRRGCSGSGPPAPARRTRRAGSSK